MSKLNLPYLALAYTCGVDVCKQTPSTEATLEAQYTTLTNLMVVTYWYTN